MTKANFKMCFINHLNALNRFICLKFTFSCPFLNKKCCFGRYTDTKTHIEHAKTAHECNRKKPSTQSINFWVPLEGFRGTGEAAPLSEFPRHYNAPKFYSQLQDATPEKFQKVGGGAGGSCLEWIFVHGVFFFFLSCPDEVWDSLLQM